ncbi:MAG: glycosyltransferase family 4 protein, partial [Thermodesulfobacteriota bacterium]
ELLDHPNDRSSHVTPTPSGGGVAVVAVFFAGLFFAWQRGYLALPALLVFLPSVLVALVGFIDDHHPLPARYRFLVQIVAAVLVVVALPRLPHPIAHLGAVGKMLVVLGLVWLLNLYNFMDGIDGLAGQQTITVAGGAALIIWLHGGGQSEMFLPLLLAAATLGFLIWNWPPARIFMGDAGSGFLGFSLGVLALLTSVSGAINLWSWLILMAVFISDATLTLARRVMRGQKFYQAHRSHAYQVLSRRWGSHARVTLAVISVNIFWCLPWAILVSYQPGYGLLICLAAFLPLVFLAWRLGAGATND